MNAEVYHSTHKKIPRGCHSHYGGVAQLPLYEPSADRPAAWIGAITLISICECGLTASNESMYFRYAHTREPKHRGRERRTEIACSAPHAAFNVGRYPTGRERAMVSTYSHAVSVEVNFRRESEKKLSQVKWTALMNSWPSRRAPLIRTPPTSVYS